MSLLIENPTNKRERVFNRDNGRCLYCGIELVFSSEYVESKKDLNRQYNMDHIIPKSQGGISAGETNYAACCYRCNVKKGPMTPQEFLDKCIERRENLKVELKRLNKRIQNLNNNFGSYLNG
nr:hypothetical protein 3 [Balneolaceae bacterium]